MHTVIKTFEDAMAYLESFNYPCTLSSYAREMMMDGVDLRDPSDLEALRVGLINFARQFRDHQEQQ